MAPASTDARRNIQRIQIHAHDRINGIDQRDGIGPGCDRRARGHDDVRNVWSQLYDHWNFRDVHDPTSNLFAIFRNLADGAAHAALAHTVWAAIVQLNAVSASVLNAVYRDVPGLPVAFHHCGNDRLTI